MLTSLVCAASLFLSSTGIVLPVAASTPESRAVEQAASQTTAAPTQNAASFLTAEERELLAANPMMLQVGGDDSEEMWSAYAAVGIACVLALGILIAIG